MAITYSTFNPSDKGANISLSLGDLKATGGIAAWQAVRSTVSVSSGKWYWEYTITSAPTDSRLHGIALSTATLSGFLGSDANGWGYYGPTGVKYNNGASTAYGASYVTGDIIGVALDMDNGRVFFSKNGTWQNSGDPAAGTGFAFNGLTGSMFAAVSLDVINESVTANFGASALNSTPPSGYNAGLYTGSAGGAITIRMALLGVGQ